MNELRAKLAELHGRGALALPLPGQGATAARHRTLAEYGRQSLSLARLIEAHTDATAIIAEAGADPARDQLYGVWASDGAQSRLEATPLAEGGWRLEGLKQFCSGATLIDTALVTAHAPEGLLLFNVALDTVGVKMGRSAWATVAFNDTATGPIEFHDVRVGATARIGDMNWYLTRAGFWHGALGPAACWAGGAMSLIDRARDLNPKDPHSRAHMGALLSIRWGLDALLVQAGAAIDEDPLDQSGEARTRALKVRHLIERWCTEVLDRFGRAMGPRLLAFDEAVARHYAELTLYIRQCHAERDLETIPDS